MELLSVGGMSPQAAVFAMFSAVTDARMSQDAGMVPPKSLSRHWNADAHTLLADGFTTFPRTVCQFPACTLRHGVGVRCAVCVAQSLTSPSPHSTRISISHSVELSLLVMSHS